MTSQRLTDADKEDLRLLFEDQDDRSAFYLHYYELTGNEQFLNMSKISQLSDWEGAVAKEANELVKDRYPDLYPEGGVMDFSQVVGDHVFQAVMDSFEKGDGSGVISERDALEAARDAWDMVGLGNQFPGNPLLAVERAKSLEFGNAWDALDSEGTDIAAEASLMALIPDIGGASSDFSEQSKAEENPIGDPVAEGAHTNEDLPADSSEAGGNVVAGLVGGFVNLEPSDPSELNLFHSIGRLVEPESLPNIPDANLGSPDQWSPVDAWQSSQDASGWGPENSEGEQQEHHGWFSSESSNFGYGFGSESTPDYGTPDYGTPDYGTPDYGTPDYGTPDFPGGSDSADSGNNLDSGE